MPQMKKAIILLLIAVFGFTTLLPMTASAVTRHSGARTVHFKAGGKHKKHRKHKKHHKRRKHRAKHKQARKK